MVVAEEAKTTEADGYVDETKTQTTVKERGGDRAGDANLRDTVS
jgi:hypothetical protein